MLLAVLLKATPAVTVKTTAMLTAVVAFIQQYIFNDWDFVVSLAVFIVVDTVTGLIAAFKNNRLNSKKMGPLVYKVLGYGALLVMTHGLTTYRIHGEQNVTFAKAIDWLSYGFIMAREALSIIENVAMIDAKLVPKAIRERLEQVLETGTVTAIVAATAEGGTATATATVTTTTPPEPAPVEAAGQ